MNKDIHPILDGMAAGNMDSLGELYNTLSVRIFNYARSITRDKEMAEDVAHDVFLLVFKGGAHCRYG